jgi:hypothetical protein
MFVMTTSARGRRKQLRFGRLICVSNVGIPTAFPAWMSETGSSMGTGGTPAHRRAGQVRVVQGLVFGVLGTAGSWFGSMPNPSHPH